MITKSNFFKLLIIILCAIIIYQQFFKGSDQPGETIRVDGKKYELLKHDIDTVVVEKVKTQYVKGEDIYHETIVEKEKKVEVPVYVDVDTNAILKKYYAKVLSKDKLILDDSLGVIEVTDTISQNRIIGRNWDAKIKQTTITDTKIVKELPKNQVYVGVGSVIGNSNALVGPNLLLKSKKDNIYGVNVYVDNNLNKYVGVNVSWKIKLKK